LRFSSLGIVLLSHRIAEQRHQPVAEFFGDLAPHLRDRRRSGIEIRTNQVAPLFGIELGGNAGRIHQIAEHHRDMPPLARSFDRSGDRRRCRSSRDRHRMATFRDVFRGPVECRKSFGRRRLVCFRAQRSDSVEQLAAMPESPDAQFLQVLRRQCRQDCFVDLVLAECSLIPFEAKAPQPLPEVHDSALTRRSRPIIAQAKRCVQDRYGGHSRPDRADSRSGHVGFPPIATDFCGAA
jgi:hypothetical protein